jgi:serine/threonine protein kinase
MSQERTVLAVLTQHGTRLSENFFNVVWCVPTTRLTLPALVSTDKVVVKQTILSTYQQFAAQVAENPVQEIQILSHIPPHPHITPLLHYHLYTSHVFLYTPYYPLGDAFNHLFVETSVTALFPLFVQLLSAVQHLHDQRVLHFDLSLENCFLFRSATTQQLQLVLGDFGHAQKLQPGEETIRVSQVFAATPGKTPYAAPELIQSQQEVSAAVDLWALGVILYMMCFREHPFTRAQIKAHQWNIPWDTVRCHEPGVEIPFSLLEGLLCVNPVERYTLAQVWDHPWVRQLKSVHREYDVPVACP